jgi:hypothetical protein
MSGVCDCAVGGRSQQGHRREQGTDDFRHALLLRVPAGGSSASAGLRRHQGNASSGTSWSPAALSRKCSKLRQDLRAPGCSFPGTRVQLVFGGEQASRFDRIAEPAGLLHHGRALCHGASRSPRRRQCRLPTHALSPDGSPGSDGRDSVHALSPFFATFHPPSAPWTCFRSASGRSRRLAA